MPTYLQLLALILPVFGVMAVGVLLRRVNVLTAAADESLLRVVVNVLYPCIIFENVHNNPALRDPGNLGWAPLVGFGTMAAGIAICYYAARALGYTVGTGLRTFAFMVGIYNYAYITVPVVERLFGREALGVLFVHNVGCEVAIWVVGVLVLSGRSLRTGWRQVFSAPVWALVVAVAVNLTGLGGQVPAVVAGVIHALAACAIPFGLILSGAVLAEHLFQKPSALVDVRTTIASVVLRLGVLTVLMLALARYGPFSPELKHVILVQAAMPAGFLPLVIVKHHGGHGLVAVRVVLATVVAGILLIPLWLRVGLAWVG
ncbi:MAG TPA: AEC family transporter [Opitutaceae bacterium]|nr:AEC family transporter [Opitutaceae bacterium]HRJ46864.1 AEC family transporter [Opitutaceae bacterium]